MIELSGIVETSCDVLFQKFHQHFSEGNCRLVYEERYPANREFYGVMIIEKLFARNDFRASLTILFRPHQLYHSHISVIGLDELNQNGEDAFFSAERCFVFEPMVFVREHFHLRDAGQKRL